MAAAAQRRQPSPVRYGVGGGMQMRQQYPDAAPSAASQRGASGQLAGESRAVTPWDVVRGYDRARRQRLVRLITLGVGGVAAVLLPSAFIPTLDTVSVVALIIVIIGSFGGYVVNRLDHVSVAGYLELAGGSLAVAWLIGARGVQQALTPTDLRLYDFFVLPIVISGVIANRRAPIVLATLTAVFTAASLILLPHSASLQLYWDGRDPQTLGSAYDVVAIPVVIQALSAVVALLGADGVRRSLLSATRADELALANERIRVQARELELHQRHLQDGILHLQGVLNAYARGNFDARAQLSESELQSLTMSLNMFLTQMQRLLREQDQRARIEYAAHELALALRRARSGMIYEPPQYTGTVFDEVLLEIVTWLQRTGGMPAQEPMRPQQPPPQSPLPPWSSPSQSSQSSQSSHWSQAHGQSYPSSPSGFHPPRLRPDEMEPS